MRSLGDIAQALVGHILAQNIGPDELVFENDSITGDELIALADAQHPEVCAACEGPWAGSAHCDQCIAVISVRESRETDTPKADPARVLEILKSRCSEDRIMDDKQRARAWEQREAIKWAEREAIKLAEREATIGHGPDCPDDCNAFRGEVPDGQAR